MVINLNPATASDYNASGNGGGDGVGVSVGVNPAVNGGVPVTPSVNVIGGTGSGSGSGGGNAVGSGSGNVGGIGTGTVNLNGNANGAENSAVSNGNGSGNGNESSSSSGGTTTNIMGIITHAIFNGIIYLHVIYAGEDYSKWITLDEAMAFCPSGVVAYTTLQISEVYDVPMELLFD